MKSVLKYPGAKNRLASWICEYIPKHDVYLEPFGGSLAVLFNKQRSHIETVNDIDEEIVNFFRILRDRGEELERAIEFTPFSRSEYKASYESSEDELERARRFAVKCWMGFGCGNLYQNGFKSGQQTKSPNPARAWSELPETIRLAVERLKGGSDRESSSHRTDKKVQYSRCFYLRRSAVLTWNPKKISLQVRNAGF